jgi:hypothetical protein
MKIRTAIEAGLVGLGLVSGGMTAFELWVQRQAIIGLENKQKILRQDLTNEVWERCITDNMVVFHEYVLRKMNGVPTNPPTFIDCDAAYPPENRGVTPTPAPVKGEASQ